MTTRLFRPLLLGILATFLVPFLLIPRPAAAGCSCCKCVCPFICCDPGSTFSFIFNAFVEYRTSFIMGTFYSGTALPSFQKMSDQFTKDKASQAGMVGTLMDGSVMNQALLDLQAQNAESTRKYMPSNQVCQAGSLTASLAVTDVKARANQIALSEVSLARNLGAIYSVAAGGGDRTTRTGWSSSRPFFVTKQTTTVGWREVCNTSSPPPDRRHNKDIDFTRTIDEAMTINNLDFTNPSKTESESNVISLGHYLYGHNQFVKRISPAEIGEDQGRQALLQDVRSVVAARSVAQNSYSVIAAMKAGSEAGTAVKPTLDKFLAGLGLSAEDAKKLIGEGPSYFAQMGVLTKKIYQSPQFYANLMDSPENVERTTASMEGFELMQDRDIFASMSRSEVLLAILVELEARKVDDLVKDRSAKGGNTP